MHGQALTERSGVRERRREERAVFIMWCPAVCYTDPYSEIPACVYITTENLHVFVVRIVCPYLLAPKYGTKKGKGMIYYVPVILIIIRSKSYGTFPSSFSFQVGVQGPPKIRKSIWVY